MRLNLVERHRFWRELCFCLMFFVFVYLHWMGVWLAAPPVLLQSFLSGEKAFLWIFLSPVQKPSLGREVMAVTWTLATLEIRNEHFNKCFPFETKYSFCWHVWMFAVVKRLLTEFYGLLMRLPHFMWQTGLALLLLLHICAKSYFHKTPLDGISFRMIWYLYFCIDIYFSSAKYIFVSVSLVFRRRRL